MSENRELNAAADAETIPAPELPYLPRGPVHYRPEIGVIGCGGIIPFHLRAYRRAGYNVTALCDINLSRAEKMRDEFFPEAAVFQNHKDLIAASRAEVLDIATHPEERSIIIEHALRADRHVLSQKPFVTDLARGRELCDLAAQRGLRLAVNQNGRWAPHFSYLRLAAAAGLLGQVSTVELASQWDHNWTADTPFNHVKHLLLYDFAIHWFDMVHCILGAEAPDRVYASATRAPNQRSAPPLVGHVCIDYPTAQATLAFNGSAFYGPSDATRIIGSEGAASSTGPDINHQRVTLHFAEGTASPGLEGTWFEAGFLGTMAELLCAIEENREPYNSARHNLGSLALCFAAILSAETHEPVRPGAVTRLPD